MKTIFRLALLPILFVCLMATAQAKAKWTYMIYMASDNDLEAYQMDDINEMLAAGSTKDVNIVLFCDRNAKSGPSEDYSGAGAGGVKDWTTAKIFLVQKNKLKEVADFGEVDTTDPLNLSRFIRIAAQTFPAEKYGLMLNDHGQGWSGGFFDDTSAVENDQLTTTEIQKAIKENIVLTGKFEMIGFDACLMAGFETANALSAYSKFMVASEEVVPGHGWYYTAPFLNLTKKPTMTGRELGSEFSKAFMGFYANNKDSAIRQDASTTTISMIDLSKIPALASAMSRFAIDLQTMVKKGREDWLKVAGAREATLNYAGGDADEYDLGDYLKNLSLQIPSLKPSCDQVSTQLKAAVIANSAGADLKASTGLTVFFPESKDTLDNKSPERYAEMAGVSSVKWSLFLDAYTEEAAKDTTAPSITNTQIDDPTITTGTKTRVSTKVVADDIAKLYFLLAIRQEGKSWIVGRLPMPGSRLSGTVAREWDGGWFMLSDGDHNYACPLMDWTITNRGFLFTVQAQQSVGGKGEWRNINMYFYVPNSGPEQDAQFVGAFMVNAFSVRGIRVQAGDLIRPVYLEANDDGSSRMIFPSDVPPLTVKSPMNLEITYRMLPSGTYWIGFIATDYSGNTDSDITEVKITRPNSPNRVQKMSESLFRQLAHLQ